MVRLPTPDWVARMVERIAAAEGLPCPEIEFRRPPAGRYTYGYPRRGAYAGYRVRYYKTYDDGYYHATADAPSQWHPTGRIVVRVRDPQLPILPSIVLHEIAHIVADRDGRREGHSAEGFYWTLYRLAERYGDEYGIDLGELARWEAGYKSRNAPAGYEMFLASRALTEAA